MVSRNKTAIWTIILIALIVGVLLLPTPQGATGRTLIFDESFNTDVIDDTKWEYPTTMSYDVLDEGAASDDNGLVMYSGGYDQYVVMKEKFDAPLIQFNIEFYIGDVTSSMKIIYVRSSEITSESPTFANAYTNMSEYYNWITVAIVGANSGSFQLSYANSDQELVYENTDTEWENNTWYKLTFVMDRANEAFNVNIGEWGGDVISGQSETKDYEQIFSKSYSDWFTKDEPVYAGIDVAWLSLVTVGQEINQRMQEIMRVDNVQFWSLSETNVTFSINLIYLAILSLIAILLGSIVGANCKHYHILMTGLGVLGLCMVVALWLNVWLFPTWALVMLIIALWCMIVLIVHETWEIDYSSYETVGKAAMVFGIIFTVLTFVEYFTLYFTNIFPVLWG